MRFSSASIRPIGSCFQLTVIHWYGLLAGAWPSTSTHTSLDDAVDALIASRCGSDIEFLDTENKPISGYSAYRRAMVPDPIPAPSAAVRARIAPAASNVQPQA